MSAPFQRALLTALVSVLVGTLAASQGLTLPWGEGPTGLGVYRDDGLVRGPRGLAWSNQTWLVADGYKGRVAVFDDQGRFLRAVPLEASSPRTMGFWVTADGSLVLQNDQLLSRWSSDGAPVGSASLGLTLPEVVLAGADQVVAVVGSGKEGRAVSWSRDFGESHTWALPTGKGTEPALRDAQGRFWLIHGAAQLQVFHWPPLLPADAHLVGWDDRGGSLWLAESRNAWRFFWAAADGSLRGHREVARSGDQVWGVGANLVVVVGESVAEGFRVSRLSAD